VRVGWERRGTGAAVVAVLLAVAAVAASAEWRQSETEHFLIVYEPQDQASADELAAICEDVYAKVTGFFRSYPDKVPVVIRGRLDYANGMTMPFPQRLELIITAPSWPWMGSRSESWLRILLTHELTHFVHLGMERGFFHALSRVFGGDASWGSAIFLPGWMLEGPTTNLETIFTSGGRGRNPFFESLYKAPAMEKSLFSLAQASYASAFPPSGRIYVAGYVLVNHLLRTYGEDTFTRIMDEYLAFPFFGPGKAIRKVTGKGMREIFEDMKASLEERYRAEAAIAGGTRTSPDRIGDWQHPVPTARGLYASRSDLEQYPAIVRLAPDGSEETVAALGLTDPSSFTVTADGLTVYAASLFADWRPVDGEEVFSDLSAIDVETGSVRRITTGAHLWHPAVSADGRHLVAVQRASSYTRLVEVNPQSGSVRVLFSEAGASVFNPAFSPDGTRIALVLNRRGMQDVVVIDFAEVSAGSREQTDPHAPVEDVNAGLAMFVLGPDAYGEYFPAWDGNGHLLFSSDRSGRLALYEADLATGDVSLVQDDPVAAYEGFVDGGTLVYASYSSKGFCLKQAPFAPVPGRPVVEPGPAESPPPQAPPAATAWTPYSDPARPYLWYPLVTLRSGEPSGWDFGVGAEVLAGSLLGASAWSLGAAWHPFTSQPELSLSLSHGFANATVEAGTTVGYYAAAGSYFLESDTRLGVSLPLVSSSAYDRGVSLSTSVGAVFVSQLGSSSPFTFTDALSAGPGAWARGVLLDAGIGFAWARSGGAIDFVAPRLTRVSAGGEVMLPVLEGSTGARFTLLAQAGMPVFWQHLVLRAGVKAAYGIASLVGSYESFAVPRGMFDAEMRPLSGRLLASLDLLAPIGLFDQPLFCGLALLGMSAGVHVEAVADWDFVPADFQVPWICAGAEVAFRIGVSSFDVPVGIGITARFDPTGTHAFDVMSDLRPYVFLSFDSFHDAWHGGPTGPRVQLVQP
jgi:Tol biopolymer transport system component